MPRRPLKRNIGRNGTRTEGLATRGGKSDRIEVFGETKGYG